MIIKRNRTNSSRLGYSIVFANELRPSVGSHSDEIYWLRLLHECITLRFRFSKHQHLPSLSPNRRESLLNERQVCCDCCLGKMLPEGSKFRQTLGEDTSICVYCQFYLDPPKTSNSYCAWKDFLQSTAMWFNLSETIRQMNDLVASMG